MLTMYAACATQEERERLEREEREREEREAREREEQEGGESSDQPSDPQASSAGVPETTDGTPSASVPEMNESDVATASSPDGPA